MDSADIEYEWFRETSSEKKSMIADESEEVIHISKGGIYTCGGWSRETNSPLTESDPVTIQEAVSNRIAVTLHPSWSQIFTGEAISLRCEIEGGEGKVWKYEWRAPNTNSPPTSSEYRISRVSGSHSGDYRCQGSSDYLLTEWSHPFKLRVSLSKPRASLETDKGVIPAGGRVYLTCSVEGSTGWRYDWFSSIPESVVVDQKIRDGTSDHTISISEGGAYYCRGRRGDPEFSTLNSLQVRIIKRVLAFVTQQPKWSQLFVGELITLRCEIQDGAEWMYEWNTSSSEKRPENSERWVITASVSSAGTYWCKGNRKMDPYSSGLESDRITLTVSSVKPKAKLRTDMTAVPVGGSVTLTCAVSSSSSGWKYYWFKDGESFKHVTPQDAVFYSNRQIRVSQEGLYWCRGGRGDPVYYTEYSESFRLCTCDPTTSVVTLQPDWPKVYSGEMITLSCESQGGDTEWEYEWRTTSSYKPSNQSDSASPSKTGQYECRGRSKSAQHNNFTEWSAPFNLTVSDKARPVLTVSPSWLSPGASVTLNCEVEHPSAGWSFYWYKAVPDLSEKSYSYELLPDGSGTAQDSYIIDGQTHTAGYVCRAGRGKPVYYTHYSEPEFVWSADVRSAASLTVSPDRIQHFTSDSVSLTCEGNSAEWRVMRFSEKGFLSLCSDCQKLNGSSYNILSLQEGVTVYWCESGSGEFSNAVNITIGDFRSESVSWILPFITGVVSGIILLLLCCYRKIKDSCFNRFTQSLNNNQSDAETHVYSSLLHGDLSVYESIRGFGNTGGGSADKYSNVSSTLQLKGHDKESCIVNHQRDSLRT